MIRRATHPTFLSLQVFFLVFAASAHAQDWPTFRHDNARTGAQPVASPLSNPEEVQKITVRWAFPETITAQVGPFSAAPIVVGETVFIGNQNGYFYALNAATGALKWQYPPGDQPGLLGGNNQFLYPGIKSSAVFARWDGQKNGAVILAAQDPVLGPYGSDGSPYGSARLFAVDAELGTLIWKSDLIAEINGLTPRSNTERHERIEHSPPLVLDNVVYVSVQSFDNPTQVGRIVALDVTTGHIIPAFQFQAVGTPTSPPGTVRGGGIWNGPATDGDDLYFTTGNTNRDYGNPPLTTEPLPNYGVSMVKINKASGKIEWAYKAVPFTSECDSDWAAGATVMNTSCGRIVASVQKDGWSYGIEAEIKRLCPLTGHSWQFPPTTNGCLFEEHTCPSDPRTRPHQDEAEHGDDDYRRPGAAWNDVFIVRTGGESRMQDGVATGYTRLHALNACAETESTRVRWIADIPNNWGGVSSVGAPSVTGGIVFVGTDQGHLVALADPSVAPGAGWRCSNVDYPTAAGCAAMGYSLVQIPRILADVQVWDGGSLTAIRTEPVLASGRVYVSSVSWNGHGHVYMLQP